MFLASIFFISCGCEGRRNLEIVPRQPDPNSGIRKPSWSIQQFRMRIGFPRRPASSLTFSRAAAMFSGCRAFIRWWASSELRCLLYRYTFCNLPQTYTSALFSTSSMSAKTVGARDCPPIKVSLADCAGRGVFATRSICSGELIHSAKPIVTHPSLALSDRVCYYCLRKLKNDTSSGSFSSLKGESGSSYCFCGEECRDLSKAYFEVESKADWSLYHDHCRAEGLKYPLMVKRFACMVISGAASADDLDILQPASLLPGAVSQMEEEFELLKWTFSKAQIDEKLTGFLTKQWYMGVLARIRINAFRIELVAASYEDILASAAASVAAQAAVGNAVYMLPSFYNHDCDPNAHIVWIDSAFAKLKALRHIEEGEELRICYLDASMDREARQRLLSEGFGFHCRCFRCLSHGSAAVKF